MITSFLYSVCILCTLLLYKTFWQWYISKCSVIECTFNISKSQFRSRSGVMYIYCKLHLIVVICCILHNLQKLSKLTLDIEKLHKLHWAKNLWTSLVFPVNCINTLHKSKIDSMCKYTAVSFLVNSLQGIFQFNSAIVKMCFLVMICHIIRTKNKLYYSLWGFHMAHSD